MLQMLIDFLGILYTKSVSMCFRSVRLFLVRNERLFWAPHRCLGHSAAQGLELRLQHRRDPRPVGPVGPIAVLSCAVGNPSETAIFYMRN